MGKKLTDEELFNKRREETIRLEQSFEYLKQNKECTIVCPIYLPIRMKKVPDKKIAMNLNAYRNWKGIVNNNYKKAFKDLIDDQIKDLKYDTPIHIHYKIFRSTKPDGMNVSSIISKFLLDAMQLTKNKTTGEMEGRDCIPDDNIEFLTESYSNGGKDVDHPRCEVYITNKD